MRQALGPGALGGPGGRGWGGRWEGGSGWGRREPKAFSFQCMTKFTTNKKKKKKKRKKKTAPLASITFLLDSHCNDPVLFS